MPVNDAFLWKAKQRVLVISRAKQLNYSIIGIDCYGIEWAHIVHRLENKSMGTFLIYNNKHMIFVTQRFNLIPDLIKNKLLYKNMSYI